MAKRNRKRGKIDKLPLDLREAVDMMIQTPAEYTYADIVDFITDNGFEVSRSSVARYAQGLNAQLEDVMLISQNFRAISDELERHPEVDTTEALCRVAAYKLLEAVRAMTAEDLTYCDPVKLMSQVPSLVRAISYKSDADKKTQELKDVAYDTFKAEIFDEMRQQDPELYARLVGYVNARSKEDD